MSKKSTITKSDNEVLSIIQKSVNQAADIVGSTMGPYGSNCLNETAWGIHLTKDGASVLANLTFEDPFENAVLNVVKDAVFKSNKNAGDGTTGTIVFIRKIINEALKLRSVGYNGIQVRNGIRIAADKIIERLKSSRKLIGTDLSIEENYNKLYNVALISTNGDAELSKIFADIFKACGKEANIKLEYSGGQETSYKITDGYQIDFGYASQFFADNADRSIVFNDPDIYVSADPIENLPEIMPIMNMHIRNGRQMVLFSTGFDTSVLNALILAKGKGLKVCCVKVNPVRAYLLEDIAKNAGAALVSSKNGISFRMDPTVVDIQLSGGCESITITENSTIIVKGHADKEAFENHMKGLSAQLERNQDNKENVAMLSERIAKLQGGIAVIYVGGKTNVSTRERYDLAEDAFNACKVALENGIQPGGGVAIARFKDNSKDIIDGIGQQFGFDSATTHGAKAFINSLDAVFTQVIDNAGMNVSRLYDKIFNEKEDFLTYDLRKVDSTGIKVGNAIELGVIDPEIVLENEIFNASDCAGLLVSAKSITVNSKSDNSIAEAISNLA